ncbi:MAG: LuxR C-terminal-related transcriptional regulator [Chloroflexi bacterium]|nr:LuxR C-terminal-related transcriptional regulator [Chloroflexota bacterium]
MTNTPNGSESSPDIEELRAERDWLLEELALSRKALVDEQETQYSAYRQLVELERVRAFDEISRGIEHRLFNKLTPVEGFAELLLFDDDAASNPQQLKEYLEVILQATQEAKNVIGSMRDFYYSTNAVDFERHQSVSEMLSAALDEEAVEEEEEESHEMATEALSPREWDVLRLLSDGKSNLDIAKTLKVSEYTIKTHIKAILSKLSLKNSTQAATYELLDQQAFNELGSSGPTLQSRSA